MQNESEEKYMSKFFRFLGIMGALMLLGMSINSGDMGKIQAVEKTVGNNEKQEIDQGVVAKIQILNFGVVSPLGINEGTIYGDGVRLRLKPSKTSTVLELMNNGESVYVYPQITAESGKGKWTYIKRDKTGTTGWVNNNYILVL